MMLANFLSQKKLAVKSRVNHCEIEASLGNILRGPFLEGPEKFSDPESHNKNLKP